MEQREVDANIKALQKAVNEKEPPKTVLIILELLKKEVHATEELLRATKAGMVVAKQRANPNKEIARLAAEIVQKWKKTVEAEKAKKSKKSSSSPAITGVSGLSSPPGGGSTSHPADQHHQAFKGDPSKRKWETDKVDPKRTGAEARDACIGLLYNGLAYMSEEAPAVVLAKAAEVEKAAFEAYHGDNSTYRSKLRSLYQNLKNRTNRDLGPRVMSGDIRPARFVVMTHDELKSAQMRREEEELNKDNMKKAQVPMAERSISDALKCGKCGEKKVSYSQAQTRSADEPMTTFCECTVCGNRWKFS